MPVEMSSRHWVIFRHPRAGYEYRARFTTSLDASSLGIGALFEVQRRDAPTPFKDVGKWEDVELID